HGSLFELLRGRDTFEGLELQQLLENFRMCDVLTKVSQAIYSDAYVCASVAVAKRRLALRPRAHRAQASPFVEACLDPDFPLVVVVVEGQQATTVNEQEAQNVAAIAVALREGLEGVRDDQQFWREQLFVVSPHHKQIHAIRRELVAARSWQPSSSVFVDTVDKMQGQEADAVIVSYAVSDPELAAMEADFLYGRNRLNVAITRARCKSIVFLPKPLLDASVEVLEVPKAREGLEFMRALVYRARQGEQLHFDFPDGSQASLYRLGS
ncbi:MAG: C-terminal helicase domain-containing protein, partial [Myxococcota bacterium]|nr:C-terminal helicase domain-containing protein [Myxococcota bacterium]